MTSDLGISRSRHSHEIRSRDRAIVTIERQQDVICTLSNGDISSDLDRPQPAIQGHGILEVNYLENGVSQARSYYRTLIGIHT